MKMAHHQAQGAPQHHPATGPRSPTWVPLPGGTPYLLIMGQLRWLGSCSLCGTSRQCCHLSHRCPSGPQTLVHEEADSCLMEGPLSWGTCPPTASPLQMTTQEGSPATALSDQTLLESRPEGQNQRQRWLEGVGSGAGRAAAGVGSLGREIRIGEGRVLTALISCTFYI